MIIQWLILCIASVLATRLALGHLIGLPPEMPQSPLRANYTDGNYNTHWANIYQMNAALRDITFANFMLVPQAHLQDKVLTLPLIDPDEMKPLLPAQAIAAAEIYLLHVDHEQARTALEVAEIEPAVDVVIADGKPRYQF